MGPRKDPWNEEVLAGYLHRVASGVVRFDGLVGKREEQLWKGSFENMRGR